MKTGFRIKEYFILACLIIFFALLSAYIYNFVPAKNSPEHIGWYLLAGVNLLFILEYALYSNFLSTRVGWEVFMLSHFIIFLALGVIFNNYLGYLNLRTLFICLAGNSVLIFKIFRLFQNAELNN